MRRPACLAVPANLFGVPTSLCRFEYNLCFDVGGFGGHRDSATVCSNVNAVPRPLRRFTCDAIPSNRCAYDGGTDACRPAPGGPSHPGVDVACGLMNRAPAAVRGAACTPAPRPRYPTLLHPTTHCQPHCALRTAHCQGSTPGLIPPPKKSKKFDACLPPRLYNRTWSIATHRKLSIGMFSSLPLSLSPSLPPLLPPSQSRLLPCAPLHPSIHPLLYHVLFVLSPGTSVPSNLCRYSNQDRSCTGSLRTRWTTAQPDFGSFCALVDHIPRSSHRQVIHFDLLLLLLFCRFLNEVVPAHSEVTVAVVV